MCPPYDAPWSISQVSTSAHPREDAAGYKKETGKTTKAENIPKIGTEKADPHGFNTTLCKRITPATLTVCLATALDASTKGWGDSLLEKREKRD